jgi:hypothetical protein
VRDLAYPLSLGAVEHLVPDELELSHELAPGEHGVAVWD